jgi:hypothetical protein
MSEPYSRLYHKFSREFPAIYADDHAFAAWGRLLLIADASWPMRPPLPRSVRPKVLACLQGAGLVLLEGDCYTVRGLDAERTRRRDAARIGAAQRWQSDGNATAMPRRDETSKDETREERTPPPPAERGRRAEGTNPRAQGRAPRDNGANPRANGASVRQEREEQKRGPTSLREIVARLQADEAQPLAPVEAPPADATAETSWFEPEGAP